MGGDIHAVDKVLATGDSAAIALLEKFLDLAQENYLKGTLDPDHGMNDVMPALYALNRHLLANFPEIFPSGFFVGDEHEVHEFVGMLLATVFRDRPLSQPATAPTRSYTAGRHIVL